MADSSAPAGGGTVSPASAGGGAPGGAGARRRPQYHGLAVSEVTRLCDDAVAVTFAVPPELARSYNFLAGQSLTLRRVIDGREHRRSYSISAPAGAAPRVGVREVVGGLFSTWLVHEVKRGDVIEVSTPSGAFTPPLDLHRAPHHVLIAAGSGITPVLSVAASVLRQPAATVTLLYGNRRAATVMFADELSDLKDRYPTRFELVHVLSRERRDAPLCSGRLDSSKLTALLGLLVDPPRVDHWWLCGPFDLVVEATAVLGRLGVAADKIHTELFYVGDDAPPKTARHDEPVPVGPTSQVTIVADGRATTMRVSTATSLLDGAQAQRPELPFACKGGVCGTCRARVVAGEVTMRRNFALDPAEIEAGFVLTCQARPVSERVVVDYDA
jgi:ring-1,2-phenylacetyl-CoA epoxidase subunit PaaE